jgi:hypothetical protein
MDDWRDDWAGNWAKNLEQWLTPITRDWEPIAREVEATMDAVIATMAESVESTVTQVDQWLTDSARELEQTALNLQEQVETHLAEQWGIEVDRLCQEVDGAIEQWATEVNDWLAPLWADWAETGFPVNPFTPEEPESEGDRATLAPPTLNQYDALYDQLNPKVPPVDRHAACVGCRHYHGRVYNGTLLICGMYPFGWTEGACPDWEA